MICVSDRKTAVNAATDASVGVRAGFYNMCDMNPDLDHVLDQVPERLAGGV